MLKMLFILFFSINSFAKISKSELRVYFSKDEVNNRISVSNEELEREIVYLQRDRRPAHYNPDRLQLKAAALADLGKEYYSKLHPIEGCTGLDPKFKCRTDDSSCVFELNNVNCKFSKKCNARQGFAPQPIPNAPGKHTKSLCVRIEDISKRLSGAKN